MSRFKAFAIASTLGVLSVAFLPARADQWNKKTILTVNDPVALPGATLEPGKYVIKLMDSQSNRNIVQVFTENEQKLLTTILAIPNYRLRPADKTEFAFWETPGSASQPRALKAWFYPGDNFGQEFAYPKEIAAEIAKANNENVPAVMTEGATDMSKAEVKTMTPSGETQELEQNQENAQVSSSSSVTTAQPSTSAESSAAITTTQPSTSAEASTRTGTGGEVATNKEESNIHAMNQNEQPATTSSSTAQSQTATSTTAAPETTSAQAQTTTSPETSASASAQSSTDQSQTAMNQSSSQLPRTASPLPLVGLAGLGSFAAAAAARLARRR